MSARNYLISDINSQRKPVKSISTVTDNKSTKNSNICNCRTIHVTSSLLFQTHCSYIRKCAWQISVAIIGQTLTTTTPKPVQIWRGADTFLMKIFDLGRTSSQLSGKWCFSMSQLHYVSFLNVMATPKQVTTTAIKLIRFAFYKTINGWLLGLVYWVKC